MGSHPESSTCFREAASRSSKAVMPHRDLAGVHLTGSTATLRHPWRTNGDDITSYRSCPCFVGETGKDCDVARTAWEDIRDQLIADTNSPPFATFSTSPTSSERPLTRSRSSATDHSPGGPCRDTPFVLCRAKDDIVCRPCCDQW